MRRNEIHMRMKLQNGIETTVPYSWAREALR
jgi:hypothetical protein